MPILTSLNLLRLKPPQITAVSIETAFQNGGIAFILLRLSLEEPFGDLASVAPVAQLMITGESPGLNPTRVCKLGEVEVC